MSNTVYKYYLNGHQYTPKNTGEITLNYERVQENGSYQYTKNLGNSVVYDNKNSRKRKKAEIIKYLPLKISLASGTI